jgi:two-component system response regulator AtoC
MVSSRRALVAIEPEVRAIADVEAFGVVTPSTDGKADLSTRHRSGAAAHRFTLDRLPPLLRPLGGSTTIVPVASLVDPQEVFVQRLQLYRITVVLGVPLPENGGVFWAGKGGADAAFSVDEVRGFEALARRIAETDRVSESREQRLSELTRLERVDAMMPLLGSVLDVREIFPKLSAIARGVLPHDMATIQVLESDHEHGRLFALDRPPSESVPMVFKTNYPAIFNENFLYGIHDDVATSDLERERPAAKAGMHSVLRVPLFLDGRIGGALEFCAVTTAAYDESDVPVARRIADYVGVAVGHQRMAEAASRAAALRERSKNLLMLDQLLPTLTNVLDVRQVFARVSEIAKQVIPHDAIGLPLVSDDRQHLAAFATAGVPEGAFPPLQPVPDTIRHLLEQPWEYEVWDDVTTVSVPVFGKRSYSELGYRSILRVPVRFEGKINGALVFFSRNVATYSVADVVVAKRIADHIAMALSHQRLAENARRNQELRSRAARLELLDELLASVTGAGELPDVFGRVSAVAQKVLEHDALLLTAVNPDGVTAKVYAHQAPDTNRFPETVEVPSDVLANPDWEHELIDDLQALDNQRNLAAARLGYRAAIRVSIRLDGQYVAGVSFLSMTPGRYTPADIIVARRIADHLALNFARERRSAAARRADEASARVSQLEARVRELTDELDARTGYQRVVGNSPAWRNILTQATQVAATETTVLLLGESGTGKEVVARFVHRASSRQDGPFIALNCAALPEHLLEAELFGFERGAFTGATQSKPGQLEQAGGGSLFLDEVGEMSLPAQAKFLRVLQEREFQRLGGTRVLRTDARIVAATNRDLPKAIAQGTFREDLYYRLNVFAINLPPLRARPDDVPPLSEAFLAEFGASLGRPPAGISRDARAMLMAYDWPGNVRELRNILERAAILCDGGLITAEHLNLKSGVREVRGVREVQGVQGVQGVQEVQEVQRVQGVQDLASVEKSMIVRALEKHRFNKSKAAKELGLTRAQLYVRMNRHGLE